MTQANGGAGVDVQNGGQQEEDFVLFKYRNERSALISVDRKWGQYEDIDMPLTPKLKQRMAEHPDLKRILRAYEEGGNGPEAVSLRSTAQNLVALHQGRNPIIHLIDSVQLVPNDKLRISWRMFPKRLLGTNPTVEKGNSVNTLKRKLLEKEEEIQSLKTEGASKDSLIDELKKKIVRLNQTVPGQGVEEPQFASEKERADFFEKKSLGLMQVLEDTRTSISGVGICLDRRIREERRAGAQRQQQQERREQSEERPEEAREDEPEGEQVPPEGEAVQPEEDPVQPAEEPLQEMEREDNQQEPEMLVAAPPQDHEIILLD